MSVSSLFSSKDSLAKKESLTKAINNKSKGEIVALQVLDILAGHKDLQAIIAIGQIGCEHKSVALRALEILEDRLKILEGLERDEAIRQIGRMGGVHISSDHEGKIFRKALEILSKIDGDEATKEIYNMGVTYGGDVALEAVDKLKGRKGHYAAEAIAGIIYFHRDLAPKVLDMLAVYPEDTAIQKMGFVGKHFGGEIALYALEKLKYREGYEATKEIARIGLAHKGGIALKALEILKERKDEVDDCKWAVYFMGAIWGEFPQYKEQVKDALTDRLQHRKKDKEYIEYVLNEIDLEEQVKKALTDRLDHSKEDIEDILNEGGLEDLDSALIVAAPGYTWN
ncbi:MAG: hypothetical protein OEY94_06400 [Alphaproteobacteria bacterium]|nr:hypothetical protein [Alphaproteobacteria bacterium]